MASRHQKLAPTFPWIDNCLFVTERDFLEMEACAINKREIPSVATGSLSTLCCWEAVVHTLDESCPEILESLLSRLS